MEERRKDEEKRSPRQQMESPPDVNSEKRGHNRVSFAIQTAVDLLFVDDIIGFFFARNHRWRETLRIGRTIARNDLNASAALLRPSADEDMSSSIEDIFFLSPYKMLVG